MSKESVIPNNLAAYTSDQLREELERRTKSAWIDHLVKKWAADLRGQKLSQDDAMTLNEKIRAEIAQASRTV